MLISLYTYIYIYYHIRFLYAAWAGGVTSAVVAPQGSNLISGVGAAFYTKGLTIDDALINGMILFKFVFVSSLSLFFITLSILIPLSIIGYLSLEINIGNNAKQQPYTSISSQISALRSLFQQQQKDASVLSVLNGTLPLVARVHQTDEMAALLRLKKEFALPWVVVVGGAEAHMIAPQLAADNVTVILSPLRTPPSTFETWRSKEDKAPALLRGSNVNTGIGFNDGTFRYQLRTHTYNNSLIGLDSIMFGDANSLLVVIFLSDII